MPTKMKLVDWWWEDGDFYTETADGKITRYKDAVITGIESHYGPGDGVVMWPITLQRMESSNAD